MGLVVVQVVNRVGEGVHQIGGKICLGSLSSFFSNRKSTKWVAGSTRFDQREREGIVLGRLGQGLGVDHTFLGGIHVRKGRLECVGQVSVLEWFVISFHVLA
jgi:hypothetical protein